MDRQLAQARILEIFDTIPPATPRRSHLCSSLASRVFSDIGMDTTDLQTCSFDDDSFRTEQTTCTSTYTFRPRPTASESQLKTSRNMNEALQLHSGMEISSIKMTEEDENIRKLNNLRDYYKSQIRELPPLHQTAAAIISDISRRAAVASSNPPFQYGNTIETRQKTASQINGSNREDIFKPKFNSTTNCDNRQKCSNVKNESEASKEKSQLSWRDYVSGENKSNRSSRTYKVERKKRSRSNKSLQTMLTMENVTKLSEMLERVNGNETYRIDNKIDRGETFRLTRSVAMIPSSSSNTYSTAEGCPTTLSAGSSNYNLNACQLTDDGVRASVINWLLRLDEYTGGNVVTLQCAVRFLDDLAALCDGLLPDTVLTCGAACFWVASKLQSARVPGAASIARQCAGAFTPQQLVACERRVLAMLVFPSAPVVPANEVERLVHLWDLHAEGEVTAVAHQLCCCALLHSHLAAHTSIQLGAAALATALQLLQPQHPLVPHLPLLRSDEDGWSVALEEELERVYRTESMQATHACSKPRHLYFLCRESALHTSTLRGMTTSDTLAYKTTVD